VKVLVACEFSGIVREAFARRGHDAWSCDLLPTELPGQHIAGDVTQHLADGWDLMIAHPPCTHLAVSGAQWWPGKQKEQTEALEFVRKLLNAPVPRIALENPVGCISTKIRKPDQIIQPYHFGHLETKTTCLWLKNLPALKHTTELKAETYALPASQRHRIWYMGSGKGKERSITFQGIADAMAQQWGAI
jgi:site-specific DNA-cytosine methylase